jgi:stress-induced morphogen
MSSMVSPENLREWLLGSDLDIHDCHVEGDGRHFYARIVSPEFSGLNTLQRHRRVYAILGNRVGTTLHALSLKTHTPEEAH